MRVRCVAEVVVHLHAGTEQTQEKLEHLAQLGVQGTVHGNHGALDARQMAREQVHYTDHLQTVDR